ncbi:MAG TPA: hypothetical protein VMA74_05255 [Dyella sp.]|uniref:hypothetical protein n=1 Tax=Dyella sp. TaxID=1869338 RepID=UPI002B8840B9|nr:hypothetical protein [Dyella sp.]HUB89122.1 hypothetical protein [Dyella sp.]
MFLVAVRALHDQPALLQAFQFTLHCASPTAGKFDQLLRKKAALRLAEQQGKNALLGSGEQGIGHADARTRSRTCCGLASVGSGAFVSLITHFG